MTSKPSQLWRFLIVGTSSVGQGSGFFITPSGILVTNFHVIKGAGKVIAHLPSGAYYLYRGLRAVR